MIQFHITSYWDPFILTFGLGFLGTAYGLMYWVGRVDGAWAEKTRRWDEEDAALREFSEQITAWEETP